MDVRLPDGTIIQGVPDGMSRADLTAKLKATHKVDFMIMIAAAVKAGSRPIRPI